MVKVKDKREVNTDKINSVQRTGLVSLVKKIQKDIENQRGRYSWEGDIRDRVHKIMEADPVVIGIRATIVSMQRQIEEAEMRIKALTGHYATPPTDPDALAKYNKIVEEEKSKIPDAISECNTAMVAILSATTLSEAKNISDSIVEKYGSSTKY